MKSSLNRTIASWAGLLALLPAGAALAQTAVVTSLHDQYLPETPIGIAFSGGPGNAKDWIGIYPDGVAPGSVGSTLWNYVDGTRTGATGFKEGNLVFNTGLAFGGTWKAFLLKNDGYEVLGETSFTVLEVGSPLLHVVQRTYQPGETISVTFTNGPANAKDWIGIYPAGVTPGSVGSTIWNYVDGTKSGATALAAGTVMVNSLVARSAAVMAAASECAMTLATRGVCLANLAPRARKFAFAVTSTRSAPMSSRLSRAMTLSSSAISARMSAGRSDQPVAEISARPRGWRVLTALVARAARPSSTSRRTRAMFSVRAVSISSGWYAGQLSR